MAWEPGPRPLWVQHVLAGEGGPVFDAAAAPLVVDDLLGEATVRAGSTDFGSDDFLEPLGVLIDSLETEANLHLVGRWRVREVILRALENRLRCLAAVAADPGIGDERIVEPLIVCGSPRAGTSLMHQLLSRDARARAPLAWEYWSPAPSPQPATWASDPRIASANRDLRIAASLSPGLDGIHEQGALLPREDGTATMPCFRSDVYGAH